MPVWLVRSSLPLSSSAAENVHHCESTLMSRATCVSACLMALQLMWLSLLLAS